jgi:hypothetical protein
VAAPKKYPDDDEAENSIFTYIDGWNNTRRGKPGVPQRDLSAL